MDKRVSSRKNQVSRGKHQASSTKKHESGVAHLGGKLNPMEQAEMLQQVLVPKMQVSRDKTEEVKHQQATQQHPIPVPQQHACEMWVRIGSDLANPEDQESEVSLVANVMFRGNLAHMGDVRDFTGTFEKLWPRLKESTERQIAELFRQQAMDEKQESKEGGE